MVGKVEENSLTKESLRDLTEPKTENSEREKIDFIPTGDFFRDSINLATQSSKLIKQIYKEKAIRLEKLSKTDNSDIPKEFCVEITEENKKILQKAYNQHSVILTTGRYIVYFELGNEIFNYPEAPKNKQIVSTEEFLRYIGKEDLIDDKKVYDGFPNRKGMDFQDEAGKPHKYLADEAGLFDFNPNKDNFEKHWKAVNFTTKEPRRNFSLGEIADKVAELALEKIEKTPDVKPLDFDFPKKEEYVPEKEYQNAVINFIDILKRQKQESGGITHGGYEIYFQNIEIGRPFLSKIKEYTIEDMKKAFGQARILKNNLCIADTNPSFFKYPNLEDYLK